MRVESLFCDCCGIGTAHDMAIHGFRILLGREPDPSGNGYINDWKYMDLCSFCYPAIRDEYGEENMEAV